MRSKKEMGGYLEGGHVGGEAVDAEHHFPGAAALGPPRTAAELAVVLPDPPPRVHREPASRDNRRLNPSINRGVLWRCKKLEKWQF